MTLRLTTREIVMLSDTDWWHSQQLNVAREAVIAMTRRHLEDNEELITTTPTREASGREDLPWKFTWRVLSMTRA